jgi:hypothetical protein
MFEVYRVLRKFHWNGYIYGPEGLCTCIEDECQQCSHTNGTGCTVCVTSRCDCLCTIHPETFGGDVWVVEAGHPRKSAIITSRFVIGDASVPDIEILLADEQVKQRLNTASGSKPMVTARKAK